MDRNITKNHLLLLEIVVQRRHVMFLWEIIKWLGGNQVVKAEKLCQEKWQYLGVLLNSSQCVMQYV